MAPKLKGAFRAASVNSAVVAVVKGVNYGARIFHHLLLIAVCKRI